MKDFFLILFYFIKKNKIKDSFISYEFNYVHLREMIRETIFGIN